MKAIMSALLALSVLTGVAASAYAFDAKSFYSELDAEKNWPKARERYTRASISKPQNAWARAISVSAAHK